MVAQRQEPVRPPVQIAAVIAQDPALAAVALDAVELDGDPLVRVDGIDGRLPVAGG